MLYQHNGKRIITNSLIPTAAEMTFGHVLKISNSHGYIEVLKRNTCVRVPVDGRVSSGYEGTFFHVSGMAISTEDRILLAISMPISNFHRTYFLVQP